MKGTRLRRAGSTTNGRLTIRRRRTFPKRIAGIRAKHGDAAAEEFKKMLLFAKAATRNGKG